MAGDFQKQQKEREANLARLKAETDKLIGEEIAEQKRLTDEKQAKLESRKATMKFLGQFVDTAIKFGNITSEQINIYLTNYQVEYGNDALVAKYLGLAVQLLTHPQTGVESTTARFGNGGLLWRGQTYKNCHELHDSLVALLADFDPFDNNIVWLEYLLEEIFGDEGKLAAEIYLERWRTTYVPMILRLVEQSKNAIEIPNIDSLTTDDLFIIQSLTGGF
ncbi:hypothetical protein [Nostoc sp. ATCC 53789]|uniref:hypothetical protein n=1 Tax=Nostoc sp. ATCC 53789 TaxID=76335 RepID=UPI000DEC5793|nr:hypothetical protein [Nostoc sp. ATCC 53789]QHG15662.1 hypothetical protein GJB62_06560 [Nostoc sp. ATCC 53789]RCJ29386.1 hypothetical protein A6V25_16060 [Nostoc sp. ATCC 53789]